MGPGWKISDEDIAAQVEPQSGNIAAIARALKVDRKTIYNRVNDNPDLRAMIEDAREGMIDNAESKLYANALNGDTTSLIFFLKTQGKRRGYTERHEVTGADGGAIETNVVGFDEVVRMAREMAMKGSDDADDDIAGDVSATDTDTEGTGTTDAGAGGGSPQV